MGEQGAPSSTYFCVLIVSSFGLPMSLSFRSKSSSKYSLGVMAVGLFTVAHSVVRSCCARSYGSELPDSKVQPHNRLHVFTARTSKSNITAFPVPSTPSFHLYVLGMEDTAMCTKCTVSWGSKKRLLSSVKPWAGLKCHAQRRSLFIPEEREPDSRTNPYSKI